MLVLSRRQGESVVIGDDVVVTVLEVRGDVVRIGVDAPRHVQVRREELLAQVADSNRSAAAPDPGAFAELSRLLGRAPEQPAPADPTEPPSAG
jgi:carbon storage regulator